MAAGFVWSVYYTDTGAEAFAVQVDADNAAELSRGWNSAGVEGAQLLPQRFSMRKVYGVSPTTGRRGSAWVATAAAPLWVGTATTFTVRTRDEAVPVDTLVVTRRRGESRAMPRAPIVV